MKNFKIFSVLNAFTEMNKHPDFWNVVSIRDKSGKHGESAAKIINNFKPLTKSILEVQFEDTILSEHKDAPRVYDIVQIIDFCRGKDDILFHCFGGISRSSASCYIVGCLDSTPEESIKRLDIRLHYPNLLMIKYAAALLEKPEMITVAEKFLDRCHQYDQSIFNQ